MTVFQYTALLLSMAMAALAAPIPEPSSVPILGPPGLRAWSQTNFEGKEVHYGPQINWNTCCEPHLPLVISKRAQDLHVIDVFTNDFPVGQPGGISSVASDPHNFCTLYP